MADRKLLRLSATLMFIGFLLFTLAMFIHATIDGKVGNGNNHPAEFLAIAAGGYWIAVHLVQFIATAIITAGLVVLFFALGETSGTPRWLGLYGAIAAGVALALAGVVYAVDGVALKQASDAWASTPTAARFASAEAIRWLEWGTRSYQSFMTGLTLVLFATTIVWTARITRPIGYIMGLDGLAFMVVGWLTGAEGFAAISGVAYYIASFLLLVWLIWLLIVAWRRKEAVQAAPA